MKQDTHMLSYVPKDMHTIKEGQISDNQMEEHMQRCIMK